MFRVGMKVVCVDADPGQGWLHDVPLKEGAIYTIRDLGVTHHGNDGVRLEGIRRVRNFMYRASRFRPVVERKTSIEIFTRMLNPNKRERVDSL